MNRFLFAMMCLSLAACEVADPTESRIVCGDDLCLGYGSDGATEHALSWHPDDPALALVSNGASVWTSTSDFERCLRAHVVANIPGDTVAWLTASFPDTEFPDRTAMLLPGAWAEHDVEVPFTGNHRVVLTVRRDGPSPVEVLRLYPENCESLPTTRPSAEPSGIF